MLTQLIAEDDVLALSVGGRIEKPDIETAFRLMDEAFARSPTVHVFVEVIGLEGMAADALFANLGRAFGYLGRLKQFGRVAVVTDQTWVRFATRVESVLLPFISYEVFQPDQRDHALAWVKGDVPSAHPHAVRLLAKADGIHEYEVSGRITAETVETLHAELTQAAKGGAPVRLLVRITRYDGFEPGILVNPKYGELELAMLRQVSRYAVVGGPDWIATTARLFDPLLKMDLRHFPADGEAAARAWLVEGRADEATT